MGKYSKINFRLSFGAIRSLNKYFYMSGIEKG